MISNIISENHILVFRNLPLLQTITSNIRRWCVTCHKHEIQNDPNRRTRIDFLKFPGTEYHTWVYDYVAENHGDLRVPRFWKVSIPGTLAEFMQMKPDMRFPLSKTPSISVLPRSMIEWASFCKIRFVQGRMIISKHKCNSIFEY